MHFVVKHSGEAYGGYCWDLYDDEQNRLLARSPHAGDADWLALQIRRLLKTVGSTKSPTFSYGSPKIAKEFGMAFGGKEEAKKAVHQAKEEVRREETYQKRQASKRRAEALSKAIKKIIIVAILAIIAGYLLQNR